MGNIVLLDELTINKIAAGEVIERPASVIKEMVENSIDAGANNITIEIKNGGISYIRITDNGKGIQKDDLEMAFERHATSKIRNATDLNYIKSMGFRGEALASIAAIANVELCSKTENDEIGSKIVIEGGQVLETSECACQKGTTITVKNLFFNTPVRYKFLKKDYTESGYIEDVVSRLALINTNVSIKLINTGKTIIQTTGDGNINNVIFSIYGKDISKAIIPVKYEYEGIKVIGVIGKPEISRSNRGNQIFFINNRYVRDKILSSASEKAYKGILPIGKFAFLVLNIEIAPDQVDVNVHPAKLEVRFQDENTVFKAVYNAIKNELLGENLIDETQIQNKDYFNNSTNNFNNELNKLINIEKNNSFINNKRTMTIEDVVAEKIEKEKTLEQDELKEWKENTKLKENIEVENYNEQKNDNIENIIESVFLEKNEKNNINSEVSFNESSSKIKNSEDKKEETIKINTLDEHKIGHKKDETIKIDIENKEIEIPTINKENTEKLNAGQVVTKLIENNIEEKSKAKFNFDDMYSKIFGKSKKGEKPTSEVNEQLSAENMISEKISLFEENEDFDLNTKKAFKLIGIAFNSYILIEIEKDLFIIDKKNAHEKIIYEKLKENYYSDESKDSQLLLLPDIIRLSHKEMGIARDNKDKFEKAGFQMEEFGDNTIKLIGAPTICVDINTKDLFLNILNEINTVARTETREIEEKFLATIASKTAIRRNEESTDEEINMLLEKLLSLKNPFEYVGGKSVAIKISKTDLEKKFSRRK